VRRSRNPSRRSFEKSKGDGKIRQGCFSWLLTLAWSGGRCRRTVSTRLLSVKPSIKAGSAFELGRIKLKQVTLETGADLMPSELNFPTVV